MEVGVLGQVVGRLGGLGADDEGAARLVQGGQVRVGEHAGVSHHHQVRGVQAVRVEKLLDHGDDRLGLGVVSFPAPHLEGESGAVHQHPDRHLGVDAALLGESDPPEVVLLLGLEVQGGHVVHQEAQVPVGGDTGVEGRLDAGAPVPPHAAGQGPEQGAHRHRVQADLVQDPGDLLLAGGLHQAGRHHLPEALVAVHGLVQAQSGPGVLEHPDEQRAARGAHQRATGDGRSRGADQCVQVQAGLARLGDPPRLRHEDSQLRVVVGGANVLEGPLAVVLGHHLDRRGSRRSRVGADRGTHRPDPTSSRLGAHHPHHTRTIPPKSRPRDAHPTKVS